MGRREIYQITLGNETVSHICAVCGIFEDKYADIVFNEQCAFWLCPECLDKFKRIMLKEDNNEDEINRNGT